MLDRGDDIQRHVPKWGRGRPQKSWFTTTVLPEGDPLPVGTFRCTSCGYLEQYAMEEFAAE